MSIARDASFQQSFAEYAAIPLALSSPMAKIAHIREFLQSKCHQCKFVGNRIQHIVYLAREQKDRGGVFSWRPEFVEALPDVVSWVETMPFLEIYGVDFVSQTADIGDHLDIFGHNNAETHLAIYEDVEPMYYRAIFSSEQDSLARSESFYVAKEYHGERRYLKLPPGEVAFALSSSTCYHGAKFNQGEFKATLAMYGRLDKKRHKELLARSLAKYAEFSIKFSDVSPVGGPGAQFPYPGAR